MEGRAESAPRLGATAAELGARALGPPLAVLALHAVLSLGLDAYDRFPGLDTPMHVLGGVAIAATFERALAALRRHGWIAAVEPAVAAALVVGGSCAAAIAWECAEFLSDRYLGTQSQVGVADTLVDLTLGVLGAVFFVAVRGWAGKRSR
jgi:hypothetical protein